jgi:hypothetical protein
MGICGCKRGREAGHNVEIRNFSLNISGDALDFCIIRNVAVTLCRDSRAMNDDVDNLLQQPFLESGIQGFLFQCNSQSL